VRASIDRLGRLTIPKSLRDLLGLVPGEVEVEITADGVGLRVEAITEGNLEERGGRLVVPASGEPITIDDVQSLRDADPARRSGGRAPLPSATEAVRRDRDAR